MLDVGFLKRKIYSLCMSLGSICVRHLGSDPLVLCFIQCVLLSLCLGPKTGRCRLVAGGVGGNDLPHWGHEAHTHKEEELFFYRVKLSCLTPNTHPVYPPPVPPPFLPSSLIM